MSWREYEEQDSFRYTCTLDNQGRVAIIDTEFMEFSGFARERSKQEIGAIGGEEVPTQVPEFDENCRIIWSNQKNSYGNLMPKMRVCYAGSTLETYDKSGRKGSEVD